MPVTPTVYIKTRGHLVFDFSPPGVQKTDSDGRFVTLPLPVGRLALSIRAPGRRLALVSRAIGPFGQEDLGTIHLQPDLPVHGVVSDEEGQPIASADLQGFWEERVMTDGRGAFILRGLDPNPTFRVRKDGYAPLDVMVTISAGGARYYRKGLNASDAKVAKDLVLTLKRMGRIEGRAIDVDTGEPVRLERIVVCNFQRKSSGEVVLRGCQSEGFEQPKPGYFAVNYPSPDEYHLTFVAPGYHDAEAFTPKVTRLETIPGVIARMKKKVEGSTPVIAKQKITGTVKRDGQPVRNGWVGLWLLEEPSVAVNSPILRGRTVVAGPIIYNSAALGNGLFKLDVPFQHHAWYVVAEEPGRVPSMLGPISISLGTEKTVEIIRPRRRSCARPGILVDGGTSDCH